MDDTLDITLSIPSLDDLEETLRKIMTLKKKYGIESINITLEVTPQDNKEFLDNLDALAVEFEKLGK